MPTTTYTNSILYPAHSPQLAVTRNVRLPVGGPYGVGGPYVKGLTIGTVSSATAQSEVRTIALTGTPTGATGTFYFTHGGGTELGVLANAVSTIPTAAEMVTALEQIFGVGNIGVVKSTLSYAITFQGSLANTRIGGLLTAVFTYTAGTSPAFTNTRTTVGSCGTGQGDVQADGSSDGTQTPKGWLRTAFYSNARGGPAVGLSVDQQESPAMYNAGFFNAADLTGLTTTGLALIGRIAEGAGLTDPDGIVTTF